MVHLRTAVERLTTRMKQEPNLFDAFLRVDNNQAPAQAASAGGGSRDGLPVSGPSMKWALGGAGGVLVVTIFLAGYYFGGGGNREALANGKPQNASEEQKPGSDEGSPSSELPKGPTGVGIDGGSDFPPVSSGSGLYNAENLYTVLAITYTDQLTFEKRAKEVAEYLREQGLPAFDPVADGKRIEILVGAAPLRGELSTIVSRLRGTKGPNGRSYDFETAIIDNIDNHIDR